MHPLVNDLLNRFPVRKTKAQKAAFREEALALLRTAGYTAQEMSGRTAGIACTNVCAGAAAEGEQPRLLYTAHYDTPPVLPFPNFITPQNMVLYLLYQLALAVVLLALPVCAFVAVILWGAPVLVCELVWIGSCFIVFYLIFNGPANKTNRNDNSSGVAAVLSAALTMPPDARPGVGFVLFDNEEKGLLGSNLYRRKRAKQALTTLVLNFDCVGDGSVFLLVLPASLRKDDALKARLSDAFSPGAGQRLCIAGAGTFYPSDQAVFRWGIGAAALLETRRGLLYLNKIHTKHDRVCQPENIAFFAAGMVRFARMNRPGQQSIPGRAPASPTGEAYGPAVPLSPDENAPAAGPAPEQTAGPSHTPGHDGLAAGAGHL